MSFHDIESNPSDSDDTTELQRRTLTRSLVAFDPRQTQAHTQARRGLTVINYGNVTSVNVYRPAQYNTGAGSGTQGYLASMSSNGDMDKQLLANGYESDLTMFHTTKEPGDTTPPSYMFQPPDWFKPGRFFSIWAPKDVEIHDRQFILLDSKNIEGKGVRVKTMDRNELNQLDRSSSAYRTTMALKDYKTADSHSHSSGHSSNRSLSYPGGQQSSKKDEDDLTKRLDSKFLTAYMDEHAHQTVHTGTFILLEHTYNIPFVKYKCIDHGMLDDESLDTLRFHYVQYLISSWRLAPKARELYGRR